MNSKSSSRSKSTTPEEFIAPVANVWTKLGNVTLSGDTACRWCEEIQKKAPMIRRNDTVYQLQKAWVRHGKIWARFVEIIDE